MPKRTINLYPRADSQNFGVNFTAEPFQPGDAIWQAWKDSGTTMFTEGGCGLDNVCTYANCRTVRPTGNDGTVTVLFDPPPTLSTYTRLKFQTWWDYGALGANPWFFPPTNAHGPKLRFALRSRDKTFYHFSPFTEGGFDAFTGTPTGNRYCNSNQPACGVGYAGPINMEWELTSHPEGGPFTLADLNGLDAGVNWVIAGPAYDVSSNNPRMRVFHLYAELDVQDLGGYIKNIRDDASHILRMQRKARNQVFLTLPAHQANYDVGSRVYATHSDGPAQSEDGWGTRKLSRRPLQLLSRTIWPEAFKFVDEHYDLFDFATNLWAAFMIDLSWTPELQGMALLDQAAGFTMARAQDGWSPRPGDGQHLRVLEDFPNLSKQGLSICNGGDVERVLRNNNVLHAAWTVTNVSGTVGVVATVGNGLVDELGYQDAVELAFSTGTRAYEQSIGTVSNVGGNLLHLRARVRQQSVTTPGTNFLQVQLKRTGLEATIPFTEYWNATTRTWDASVVNNAIDASAAFGEVISDAIPCDRTADAPPTYTVKVGRISGSITGTFILALVNLQLGGPSNGASYGARPAIVTLAATIARVADDWTFENTPEVSWFTDRGVAICEFQPEFLASAMPDGETKPILYALHSSTGTGTYDRLDYIHDSVTPTFRFRRHVDTFGDFDVSVPVSTPLDRTKAVRVWCRWLDADGWEGFAPFTMSVGFSVDDVDTGALDEQSDADAPGFTGVIGTTDEIRLGRDASGLYLDAYVRMADIKRNPISALDATWRR